MIKKKCDSCGKKIQKKFDFCPWCGHSFRPQKEKANFGMIGREDRSDGNMFASELKLPFGLNKIVGNLMKQIENEMNSLDNNPQRPGGIKIQFSTGMPGQMKLQGQPKKQPRNDEFPELKEEISEKEQIRRTRLPKVEAESKLKRIGDEIIFELIVPGIKSKRDIEFNQVEKGLEIRAYTDKACYTKTIPLEPENMKFAIRKDKVILETKG